MNVTLFGTADTTTTTTVPPPVEVVFDYHGQRWELWIVPLLFLILAWLAVCRLLIPALRSALEGEASQPSLRHYLRSMWTPGAPGGAPPGAPGPAAPPPPQVSPAGFRGRFLGLDLHGWIRRMETEAVEADRGMVGAGAAAAALTRRSQLEGLEKPPQALLDALTQQPPQPGAAHAAFEYLVGVTVSDIDRGLTAVRKALFMTTVATAAVLVLVLTTNTAPVLLVGAVGALSFRLARNVTGAHTGLGKEWASLVAVPPAGALAAFGGTLVLHLLTRMELIGGVFGQVSPAGVDLGTLAIAFLLGFAERFWTR